MRTGRSFSEPSRPNGTLQGCGSLLIVILFIIACLTLSLAQQPAAGGPGGGRNCPRCGFLSDAGWRYCPACGWDLRVLTGADGAARLKSVGTSVVGLILVREPPTIQEIFPPAVAKRLSRYLIYHRRGRTKQFATAFPFLKPGLFVTSARALEWVEVVDARTYNNRMVPAQIVGYDIPSGIGVVKAEVAGATPLTGSDLTPRESDLTWAICYPVAISDEKVEYLPEAFHRGRVSAVGQEGTGLAAFEHFLRTDHTLEEGCLGGALLDSYGAAAGIVLGSPDPGISYALPVSDLKTVVELLAEKKKPDRPFFGMGVTPPDDRRRAKFHLPPETTLPVVAYLIPRSPAAKAGVKPGDLLAAVGGEKTSNVAAAGARLLKNSPSGQIVLLTMLREGKEVSVSIVPTRRPTRVMLAPGDELQESLQANLLEVTTGPTFQQGLRVTDLVRGGRGEQDGYREGDLIFAVDGKGVRHLSALDEIVQDTNSHIFGEKNENPEGPPRLSSYSMVVGVRTAEKGEKDDRFYVNLFPDALTAPVY